MLGNILDHHSPYFLFCPSSFFNAGSGEGLADRRKWALPSNLLSEVITSVSLTDRTFLTPKCISFLETLFHLVCEKNDTKDTEFTQSSAFD